MVQPADATERDHFGPLAWFGSEFVTNPRYAESLVDSLRDRSGGLPEYFELIVEAKLRNDRPVAVRYVRHRRLAATGK